tara:strand:- start:306660 stop:307085 length:426 start_codon:yes stop_codon:yes gene_type:complete
MRTILSIIFGLSLILTPAFALAQTPGGNPGGTGTPGGNPGDVGTPGGNPGGGGFTLKNPLQADSLEEFLTEILDFIVRLGTIVVIVMIVVVGFLFVSARGNPEKIKEAREALLWTLVGGVILIGAFVIAEAIEATVKAISS